MQKGMIEFLRDFSLSGPSVFWVGNRSTPEFGID